MQVALSLYVHLGKHLLLQLEAFVSLLLARLGDARGGAHATELQEVALEVPCPCACHNLCVTSAHATTTAAHPDWPVPAIWSCWNVCMAASVKLSTPGGIQLLGLSWIMHPPSQSCSSRNP